MYLFNDGSDGSPKTGELRQVAYSDSNTSDIRFTHDRLGRLTQVETGEADNLLQHQRFPIVQPAPDGVHGLSQ